MHHNLIYSRFLWTDDLIHNEGPECASFTLFISHIEFRKLSAVRPTILVLKVHAAQAV